MNFIIYMRSIFAQMDGKHFLNNLLAGDEDGGITERHHSPPTFGTFFPSVVCQTVMHLVGLLDDAEVNQEGVSGL